MVLVNRRSDGYCQLESFLMFAPGDEVVCIKQPDRADYCINRDYTRRFWNGSVPLVGNIYTVAQIGYLQDDLFIVLTEIKEDVCFRADHFRKVQKKGFEEPRRVAKELEDA